MSSMLIGVAERAGAGVRDAVSVMSVCRLIGMCPSTRFKKISPVLVPCAAEWVWVHLSRSWRRAPTTHMLEEVVLELDDVGVPDLPGSQQSPPTRCSRRTRTLSPAHTQIEPHLHPGRDLKLAALEPPVLQYALDGNDLASICRL